jgi:hypothetical protein
MALTDSDKRLKRIPDNDRTTMRAKADRVLMADVSQADIDLSKPSVYQLMDLETARVHSENPTLTQAELDALKAGQITEPTGKFKKKK